MKNKFWSIINDKEAEKYGVQIVEWEEISLLSVDITKIPDNMSFKDFGEFLLKEGIVTHT